LSIAAAAWGHEERRDENMSVRRLMLRNVDCDLADKTIRQRRPRHRLDLLGPLITRQAGGQVAAEVPGADLIRLTASFGRLVRQLPAKIRAVDPLRRTVRNDRH